MKEFDADTYKDGKGNFNEEDENLLISLLKKDGASGRVLDIGCGDGRFTHRIKKELPDLEIIGIDNLPSQIKSATATPSEIRFQLADILDYTSENKFDSTYSFYAFPHIPKSKLVEALASVRNLLKEGGRFYLFTNICLFDTSMTSEDEQEACDIVFLDNWPSQINLVMIQEMRDMFKKTEFIEIDNKKLVTGAKIKNYGDMISWMFVLE